MSSDQYYRRAPDSAQTPERANTAPGRNFFLRVDHQKRVFREFGPKIGAVGLAIYHILCLHAHSLTGQTFLGRRTICEQAKLGPKTVRESLALLAALQLIVMAPGRGNTPTIYTVLPLAESQDGRLPFDEPAVVSPQYHKPDPVVVLESPSCGTEKTPLRYSGGLRNKDELNVLTNRGTNSRASAANLDLQVSEIGHLHPSNAHLPRKNLLPPTEEHAIAEAITRDGYEAVLAGTMALREAVAHWPRDELQYIPNLVKFYRRSDYLKDPQLWERGNGKRTSAHRERTVNNLSVAERVIRRELALAKTRGDRSGFN